MVSMTRVSVFILLLLGSMQLYGQAVSIEKDIVYAPIWYLKLDIYRPPNQGTSLRPAVILIHGGGWTSFDKSTMQHMGEFLARGGYVAFAVDYRLFHGAENRWPAQLDDVQRAVRWIRANAAKYEVNPDHVGAFGHSAGAQLACLLGMEDTRDNSDPDLARFSSRVQAVVDVSGPVDFTRDHDSEGNAFLTSFLGVNFKQNAEAWRDASPVFHVDQKNAPFLIVHGTADESVPVAQADEFYDKLRSMGVPAQILKVDDGHMFNKPENRRRLAFETQVFFDHYLQ